jgi:hypothetical protein
MTRGKGGAIREGNTELERKGNGIGIRKELELEGNEKGMEEEDISRKIARDKLAVVEVV